MKKIECKDDVQNVNIPMSTITNLSIPISITNPVKACDYHSFFINLNAIQSFPEVPLFIQVLKT